MKFSGSYRWNNIFLIKYKQSKNNKLEIGTLLDWRGNFLTNVEEKIANPSSKKKIFQLKIYPFCLKFY